MKHIPISLFQQALQTERLNQLVEYIDVRTPDEYRAQHIEGVKNIPLDELRDRLLELQDKKTIYVHCRSGGRSRRGIEELERLGVMAELINVEGGIMAWEAAGFETRSLHSSRSLNEKT